MVPKLALLFCLGFVFWLFRRDMRWRRLPSAALWIPGVWLAMASSRQMSFWLGVMGFGGGGGGEASNLEGSPVNVIFNGSLFLITLVVLHRRGFSWAEFAGANKALVAIYAFFLISMLWSPFPFPTVKRLIQEFGCVLTSFIVLTEKNPTTAFRILFVRVSYVLFPLSVVFIRYFPEIGRTVSTVSGTHMLCGIADHKNSLGQLTVVFCMVLLWDLMGTEKEEGTARRKIEQWPRWLNMAIGLYLLVISSCGTALVCLGIGVVLLFGCKRLVRMKNPRRVFILGVTSIVCLMAINQIFEVSSRVSEAMGRGSGLSGRTEIWNKILEKNTHHLIGSGFRGFWETSEGESVWRELGTNPLITAHNGYLETYLNGGLIGLFLLTVFLWSTGLNAVNKLIRGDPIGKLGIVFWPILLILNATESNFLQTGPVWLTVLLVTMNTPWQDRRRHLAAVKKARERSRESRVSTSDGSIPAPA